MKHWLLSRRMTLGVVSALLALVLVASLVPQRGGTAAETFAKWEAEHRSILPLVRILGLDHLYSTPLFILLCLVAVIILILSCFDQGRQTFARTFHAPPLQGEAIPVGADRDRLMAVLVRHGYRPMGGRPALRFVKQPWGYSGNFLLHLGMTVTVVASLFIALTYQRSVLTLYEGVPHPVEAGWEAEEHGLLAEVLRFPYQLRLDGLHREFTTSGAMVWMASDLSLRDGKGRDTKLRVPLNAIIEHHGIRIYQSISYGDLFVVDFTGPDGEEHTAPLPLYQPNDLADTSYRDFQFSWLPYHLSSHYEADAEKRSMESANRLLALRLTENGREVGKAYLLPGEEGMLGPYRVKLLGVGTWSNLIFVRIVGMPLVFLGFAVIVAGLTLQYATPPREVGIEETATGRWRICWRASRFADFYADEYAAILRELGEEKR